MDNKIVVNIIASVIMVIVTVLTLLTNSSLLYLLLNRPKLRGDLSNVFIINLCIIGTVASLTVLPITTANFVTDSYIFPSPLCRVTGFVNSLLTLEDIYTVSVASVDRYILLAHPMAHAAYITVFRTAVVISCTWLLAIIIALLPLVGWSQYVFQPKRARCSYALEKSLSCRSYVITIAVVGLLLPFCLYLCMYIAIFHVAKTSQRQVRPAPLCVTTVDQMTARNSSNASILSASLVHFNGKKLSKAAKVLLLVTGTFVLFFAPQFLVELCVSEDDLSCSAGLLLSWLTYASLALHPILYSFLNRCVREEIMIALRNVKKLFKRNHNIQNNNRTSEMEDFYQFLERTSVANILETERSTA